MKLFGSGNGQEAQSRRSVPSYLRLSEAGVYYALLLLVAILTIASRATGRPNYLAGQNLANVLEQASLVAILVTFMTIVLISGNFDLSIASVAALGAAVFLSTIETYGFWLALLAALMTGLAAGLLNGAIVQYVGVNAFIVTLGSLTALRGLVLIITDGRTITVREDEARSALRAYQNGAWTIPNSLLVIGLTLAAIAAIRWLRSRSMPLGQVVIAVAFIIGSAFITYDIRLAKTVWYMAVVAITLTLIIRYTIVGRRLFAVGSNAEATRLAGISVNRYKVGAFALMGLSAGFVGSLSAAKLGAINPTGLQGLELTVIAAAVLGGTSLFGGSGSIPKSIAGALILFTLANGFNVLNLGANYQGLIEGTVIIAAAATYTIAERRSAKGPRPVPPDSQIHHDEQDAHDKEVEQASPPPPDLSNETPTKPQSPCATEQQELQS
jgi:ribose transport system permease protein